MDQTMMKLEQSKLPGWIETKQLRPVCCMLELLYTLMMDRNDVLEDKLGFHQFIGLLAAS